MRLYEVIFNEDIPSLIMFANTRQDIRKKYPGIVDKIYRIDII